MCIFKMNLRKLFTSGKPKDICVRQLIPLHTNVIMQERFPHCRMNFISSYEAASWDVL